ncbi:Kelch repeat-containing protein [Promicromonospora sukumoe]|uniref:Kelch repeat-containing protein n=1 Tax=Promicromonospora sukumoe TaxID=88382 RepID=UPI003666D9AC
MTRHPVPPRPRTALAVLAAGAMLTTACTTGPTSPGAPPGRTGTWEERAPMALERQELYPEVVDDRIYVAGGLLNPNTGVSAHFDAYDPATDSWDRLATMPQARHHIGLAEADGSLYAVGGFSGGFPRWRAESDTFVYSPDDDTWSSGVDLPEPRAEFVIESVRDQVFVIGGRVRETPGATTFTTHVDSRTNEMFDPAAGTWTTLAPAPTARNSAASAVVDDRIYVIGGREFSLAEDGSAVQENVATVEVYDPADDEWETVAPLPEARGGLAAAVHDGSIYVFGGEQHDPDPVVYDDVWRYDPGTDEWTAAGTLPTPRHGLGAATVGDVVYTFGGGTEVGGNFAGTRNEAFTPAER